MIVLPRHPPSCEGSRQHAINIAQHPSVDRRTQRTSAVAPTSARCRPQSTIRAAPRTSIRKAKARTMRAVEWEPFKERIRELYVEEDLPLESVIATLKRESGLEATKRQYTSQIHRWGFDKNVKPHEMLYIAVLFQKQKDSKEQPLRFRVRGKDVNSSKIERFIKSNPLSLDCIPVKPIDVVVDKWSPAELGEQPKPVDTPDLITELPLYSRSMDLGSESTFRIVIRQDRPLTPLFREDELIEETASDACVPMPNSFAFRRPQTAHAVVPDTDQSLSCDDSAFRVVDPSQLTSTARPKARLERYYKEADERKLQQELLFLQSTPMKSRLEYLDKVYDYTYMLNSRGRYELSDTLARRLHATLYPARLKDRRTLMAMRMLATVLDNRGHLQEALSMCEKAVNLGTGSSVFQSSDVIPAKLMLARMLLRTSRSNEADELCSQSLHGIRQHPDRHMRLYLMHKLLGAIKELHSVTGQLSVPLLSHIQCLTSKSETLQPPFNLDTCRYLAEVAYFLESSGDRQGAIRLTKTALKGFLNTMGPIHRYTLWSQSFLSRLIAEQGNLEEAETMAEQVVVNASQLFSAGCYYIENYKSPLARIHFDQKKFDSAINLQRGVVDVAVETLGHLDDKTLAHRETLGYMYGLMGMQSKANDILLDCLRIRADEFGSDDPRTVAVRESIGGDLRAGYRKSLRGHPT